ncbi:MAG: AsmA-like C-terminal region-containing protein, partial [Pseudomonadota bacterium]
VALDIALVRGTDRPLLIGSVATEAFTLPSDRATPSAPGGSGGAAAPAPSSGWSTEPIQTSGLFAVDTDLRLSAGEIVLGSLVLSDVSASLTGTDGRHVLEIASARLWGGRIAGSVVANGRGTFSARADLVADGVALDEAALALTGDARLQGSGSGRVSVVAQGASLDALMRDLNGDGAIDLGPGRIEGLDLLSLLAAGDPDGAVSGGDTTYTAVTATFGIFDGVLTNDDLEMQAAWGGLTGRGRVDIGGRTVDYLAIPRLRAGAGGLVVPVRITGPWDDLRYRPDLEALAEEGFEDEIDALEDAATEAARQAVEEELGIEIAPDASREEAIDQIEDALGDRLRDEIEDGLRGLFE